MPVGQAAKQTPLGRRHLSLRECQPLERKKSLDKLKDSIRAKTGRNRGVSLETVIARDGRSAFTRDGYREIVRLVVVSDDACFPVIEIAFS